MTDRLLDRRVLVVDDDPDVRESMEAAFRAEGADAVGVADGNEAVRVCLAGKPDVVVLDMMLPRRSGFLVLEKIKGFEDSPAVIMITANEGRRHQAYAESLGVDRYLNKPVPMTLLIDEVLQLALERDKHVPRRQPEPAQQADDAGDDYEDDDEYEDDEDDDES